MDSNWSVSRRSQQSWRRSKRKREEKDLQGMILPFEPLSFTFDHITYSVAASGVRMLRAHAVHNTTYAVPTPLHEPAS